MRGRSKTLLMSDWVNVAKAAARKSLAFGCEELAEVVSRLQEKTAA